MKEIDDALDQFPKFSMSVLPTPLYQLKTISQETGAHVFCKRDDLTGFGMGGNKTRKLDFLIADACSRGLDTIVTVGANQSNFCRITAAAGAANGLEVHLVLGISEGSTYTAGRQRPQAMVSRATIRNKNLS